MIHRLVPPFLIWHFQLHGTPLEISAVPSDTSGVAHTFYVEANLTFCKCQYRGYGERNPHQDKTQSNRKAKMAIPYYWVDLALERLTLSYNEMLREQNTGRDRKNLKNLLWHYTDWERQALNSLLFSLQWWSFRYNDIKKWFMWSNKGNIWWKSIKFW